MALHDITMQQVLKLPPKGDGTVLRKGWVHCALLEIEYLGSVLIAGLFQKYYTIVHKSRFADPFFGRFCNFFKMFR